MNKDTSLKIYKSTGEEAGSVKLSPEIFSVDVAPELVHQVVNSALSKSRNTVASTKNRGQVRGGGKKPWKQKGTGRARAGSIRSPLWKGGGVTFGPSAERNFEKNVTKKMKRIGLKASLTEKAATGKVLVLDKLELKDPKTKELYGLIQGLGKKFEFIGKNLLIVVTGKNEKLFRAGKNLPSVNIIRSNNLNILDVMKADSLIFTEEAFNKINTNLV